MFYYISLMGFYPTKNLGLQILRKKPKSTLFYTHPQYKTVVYSTFWWIFETIHFVENAVFIVKATQALTLSHIKLGKKEDYGIDSKIS